MENKWRAARYGLDGKLIDFGTRIEVPMRDLVEEYLAFVDDVVDELGSREEVNGIRRIVENGNGADRQLRVFKETGDLTKVVDYIIEETESSCSMHELAKPLVDPVRSRIHRRARATRCTCACASSRKKK